MAFLSGSPARFRGSSSAAKRRWKMVMSYTPDWLVTLVLSAIFFAMDNISGFKREFSLTDTSLFHPFAVHERVPDWALYIIAFLSPFLLQIAVNYLTVRSWWDFHNSFLGLFLSGAITGAITQFTKVTVGRPRPDLIARCIPEHGAVDPFEGLSTFHICTQTNRHMLEDGFRSFPSGHSSLSFAGLGFFSFYLAGKLHLFDERGHTVKAWLSLAPLSGAALVAISRTMDYRHHWQDVLAGSILGISVAYFSYRQYYPALNAELSHRPYAPRIPRDQETTLPTHHRQPSSMDGLPEDPRLFARHRQSSYRDEIGSSHEGELDGTVLRGGPGASSPARETWRKVDGSSRDPGQGEESF